MKKSLFFAFCSIISLCSFILSSKERVMNSLTANGYISWYQSKYYPFRDTVRVEDITYCVEWIPYEVELAREMLQENMTKKEFKKRYLTQKPNDFHLRLSIILPASDLYSYKLRSDESKTSRTEYYSFRIKQDLLIKEKSGEDSLHCQQTLLERTIPNPKTRLDLYFEDKLLREECELIFNDIVFTKQKIHFDLSSIQKNRIPKLKY